MSIRKFACCPNCSMVLIQAEAMKNAVIRCPNCKRKVFIEINNGRVVTKVYESS